ARWPRAAVARRARRGPARRGAAAARRLLLHPAKRLVGGRALARLALVALAVNARRSLARGLLATRARRRLGGRLTGERVIERLLRRSGAGGLADRELGLQRRGLDVA